MLYNNFSTLINHIKSSHSCLDFCNHTLHLHLSPSGRSHSPLRPDSSNPTSFWVHNDHWHDFATGQHGDIIDLAALTLFNGDKGRAIEYLAGVSLKSSPFSRDTIRDYSHHIKSLEDDINHWHSLLRTQDREYLHSRAISDDTINRLKIGYDPDRDRLVVPYFRNGHAVYYAARDRSGKADLPKEHPQHRAKYIKASTDPNSPMAKSYSQFLINDIWGLHTITGTRKPQLDEDGYEIDDPRDYTLCILEGMFDAVSFEQDRWQTLSASTGPFSSTQKPEVLSICKMFKRVFICYDSDKSGHKFQNAMCRWLASENIPFICGHTPPTFNGQKIKDVSDYYSAGGDLSLLVKNAVSGMSGLAQAFSGTDDMREFLNKYGVFMDSVDLEQLQRGSLSYAMQCRQNILQACADVSGDKGVMDKGSLSEIEDELMQEQGNLAPKVFADCQKWLKIAREFQGNIIEKVIKEAKKYACSDAKIGERVTAHHTLKYADNDSFYEYLHGRWEAISDQFVRRYVAEIFGDKANYAKMCSTANYLKALLAERVEFNRKWVMNFVNGTLDLQTEQFREHSPEDLCTTQLPYNYDPSATAKKWLDYINKVVDDASERALLQEIAGYVMFSDNRLQKFFWLIGRGGNGKGVFMNTLREVYGPENCSSLEMGRLSSPFDPIALKNSMLNLCYEAKAVMNGSEEILKAIVAGDPIMAAHKGVDAETFKTRAKLIVASNNFFKSADTSLGLLRRIIFVDFPNVFADSDGDVKALQSALLEELPGIFNWAFAGFKRLKERESFTQTVGHLEMMERFMSIMNPMFAFTNEILSPLEGQTLTLGEIYKGMYCAWCEENNTEILSRLDFENTLNSVLPQLLPGIVVDRDVKNGTHYIFPMKNFAGVEEFLRSGWQITGRKLRRLEVYGAYLSWCKANNETAIDKRTFSGVLAEMVGEILPDAVITKGVRGTYYEFPNTENGGCEDGEDTASEDASGTVEAPAVHDEVHKPDEAVCDDGCGAADFTDGLKEVEGQLSFACETLEGINGSRGVKRSETPAESFAREIAEEYQRKPDLRPSVLAVDVLRKTEEGRSILRRWNME